MSFIPGLRFAATWAMILRPFGTRFLFGQCGSHCHRLLLCNGWLEDAQFQFDVPGVAIDQCRFFSYRSDIDSEEDFTRRIYCDMFIFAHRDDDLYRSMGRSCPDNKNSFLVIAIRRASYVISVYLFIHKKKVAQLALNLKSVGN